MPITYEKSECLCIDAEALEMARLLLRLKHRLIQIKAKRPGQRYRVGRKSPRALSERQYHVLVFIHYLNICTLKEMSQGMHISPSGLSLVISKMVENGYVEKHHGAQYADKRVVPFGITEKGLEALQQLTKEIILETESFYNQLSPHAQQLLAEALHLYTMAYPQMESKYILLEEDDVHTPSTDARTIAKRIFYGSLAVSGFFTRCEKDFNTNGKSLLPISFSQFQLLHAISSCNLHTIKEMHRFFKLSESTVSILISKLSQEGYIRAELPQGDMDQRKKFFHLTQKGECILQEATEQLMLFFVEHYKTLNATTRLYLFKGVQKTYELLNVLETENMEAMLS